MLIVTGWVSARPGATTTRVVRLFAFTWKAHATLAMFSVGSPAPHGGGALPEGSGAVTPGRGLIGRSPRSCTSPAGGSPGAAWPGSPAVASGVGRSVPGGGCTPDGGCAGCPAAWAIWEVGGGGDDVLGSAAQPAKPRSNKPVTTNHTDRSCCMLYLLGRFETVGVAFNPTHPLIIVASTPALPGPCFRSG